MSTDNQVNVQIDSIWKHKKTENIYKVVGFCIIEHSMEIGVLYKMLGEDVKFLYPWCRPLSEFKDGRYEFVK